MGSGTSKQQLGQRVMAAQKKLQSDLAMQNARCAQIRAASAETLDVMVQSIAASVRSCSPFSESTLLVAFASNPEETQRILLKACKQVLSAPIDKGEYAWLEQHVLRSSIWMMRRQDGSFLFEALLAITKSMADKIDGSMHAIHRHLLRHDDWSKVLAINNETVVERQDDDRVGLLHDKGITDLTDALADANDDEKQHQMGGADSDGDGDMQELATFVDTNLAVNMLTATAKRLNDEFQMHFEHVMERFGTFRAGPSKAVERCQSKIENEYQKEPYPAAAKLLDLVRCSVSFNTVAQLVDGYEGLRRYIDSATSPMELARIKNGFLEQQEAGYRDTSRSTSSSILRQSPSTRSA